MIPSILELKNQLISDNTHCALESRWKHRGWRSADRVVLNIPKVASNSLGLAIVDHGGSSVDNILDPELESCEKVVVLRDPAVRWRGCMAEHLSHRVERGESLQSVIQFIHSGTWRAAEYIDMHLFSQTAYCAGLHIDSTVWFRLENGVDQVFRYLGLTDQSPHINGGQQNQANGRHILRQEIELMYDEQIDRYVKQLYQSDYQLMELVNFQGGDLI